LNKSCSLNTPPQSLISEARMVDFLQKGLAGTTDGHGPQTRQDRDCLDSKSKTCQCFRGERKCRKLRARLIIGTVRAPETFSEIFRVWRSIFLRRHPIINLRQYQSRANDCSRSLTQAVIHGDRLHGERRMISDTFLRLNDPHLDPDARSPHSLRSPLLIYIGK
jgi:hypothetical protein